MTKVDVLDTHAWSIRVTVPIAFTHRKSKTSTFVVFIVRRFVIRLFSYSTKSILSLFYGVEYRMACFKVRFKGVR